MRKSVFAALVAVLFFTFVSCEKEEMQINPDRIQQIRQEMSKAKYQPTELVLALYGEKKNAGDLKSTEVVKPTIAFSVPNNDIEIYSDNTFKKVWVWTMTQNGQIVGNGIIAINYNQDYQQINDPEFFIGWNNYYCTLVSFIANFQNAQTMISFTFPTTTGMLSFDTYTDCQSYMEMWLPQLNFDCSWETVGGAMFGGMMSFNPSHQTEVSMTISELQSNITDYIKFNTRVFQPNTKVIINISDDEDWWSAQVTLNFIKGKMLPSMVMLPITFEPNQLFYQIISYPNGIAEYSEFITLNCTLSYIQDNGVRVWEAE